MGRWVTDLASLQHGQLALHPVRLSLGRTNHMQRADTLAVQPSILSKALQRQTHAPLYQLPHKKATRALT